MPEQPTDKLNPYTMKKFEAIDSYDPYDDAISDLNQAFHYSYNQLIQETHAVLGSKGNPVMIMFADKIMLFHEGKQETVTVLPELYHRIKAVSHVSFGVYISMVSHGYGELKDSVRINLELAKEMIDDALNIISEMSIPKSHMQTQVQTLEIACKAIEEVLASGQVTEAQVKRFGKQNAPLYLENAAFGAKLELDQLHDAVSGWKAAMTDKEWDALYVVICAGHQARYRELTRQYFQKLLREEEGIGAGQENRVIYAEQIHDVDAALDLLARHINDQAASKTFFGDKLRLQQDLMSEGAADYLDELLGE